MITKKGYNGKMFTLIDEKTGTPLEIGNEVTNFRNESGILDSAEPPHKESSSGFVYIKMNGDSYNRQAYTTVIGAKWEER